MVLELLPGTELLKPLGFSSEGDRDVFRKAPKFPKDGGWSLDWKFGTFFLFLTMLLDLVGF